MAREGSLTATLEQTTGPKGIPGVTKNNKKCVLFLGFHKMKNTKTLITRGKRSIFSRALFLIVVALQLLFCSLTLSCHENAPAQFFYSQISIFSFSLPFYSFSLSLSRLSFSLHYFYIVTQILAKENVFRRSKGERQRERSNNAIINNFPHLLIFDDLMSGHKPLQLDGCHFRRDLWPVVCGIAMLLAVQEDPTGFFHGKSRKNSGKTQVKLCKVV